MKRFEILIIGGGPAAITICKILNQKNKSASSGRKTTP